MHIVQFPVDCHCHFVIFPFIIADKRSVGKYSNELLDLDGYGRRLWIWKRTTKFLHRCCFVLVVDSLLQSDSQFTNQKKQTLDFAPFSNLDCMLRSSKKVFIKSKAELTLTCFDLIWQLKKRIHFCVEFGFHFVIFVIGKAGNGERKQILK